MHKGSLNGFDNSDNLVFLLSIGADPIIRVWDFDYLLRGPGSN
jgi:WD repeat-containing protein 90